MLWQPMLDLSKKKQRFLYSDYWTMKTMEVGSKNVFVMTPWSKLIMDDNSGATLYFFCRLWM